MDLCYCRVTVSVLLCVLFWSGRAQESGCRVSAEAGTHTSVNCSRQQFHDIPDLSPLAERINQNSQLLLTFYNNSISNLTQLPALPGTRVAVIFKNNTITDIVDSAFKNIHRIVYLDLSNNRISGEVLRSEIFQGPFQDDSYDCIALESLNLGNNQIHSLDKYLFKHTPNLTRLSLNNNPIEILDTVTVLALSSAVKLTYLDLSKTDINSIPLDAFRGLVNLEHIDLSSNKFVTVPESLALVGTSLQYLTFNDNPIVELNDDSFVGLSSLLELEIGENEYLEEIKRSTFTPLKSLRVLHLCHNPNLRYISHNAFRGLKDKWTLKEVYLDDNNLSELSTDLMPWNKLELLGMTGNNWLCNCDLVNIVTTQGAGLKFRPNEVAYCAAPMKLIGQNVTSVSLIYCPTFDAAYTQKRSVFSTNMKPKHVLWSIFGVGIVVVIGMLIGLLVNSIKLFYKKKIRSEPIRYVNIVNDSNYA